MSDKHYVGEVGTKVIVDAGEDITSATKLEMYIKKPLGSEETWDAVAFESNYLKHDTASGDFSEPGKYLIQIYVEMPDWQGKGKTDEFVISKDFE